ncbi:hypothetical protein VHEMI09787 [[Torrubiella] hemipterigena]|uniref:Poly A polymerase head domain-containing protein n=1 Tax=[Torrubiella] hemipterigena TaxID=1531966 RepID=A0A0A1TQR0_9HYPO|nr:hypothetical protein VHEMI09787 [[Torrubiella] hemipterigena]
MRSRLHILRHVMKRKFGYFAREKSTFTARYTMNTQNPTITLDKKEQQLRSLLLDVAGSLNASGKVTEPLVLRWAGGWVRDKLLGLDSHDIDIAINAMTGEPFVEFMCEYCQRPEVIKAHDIGPDDIGNLHKIKSNPDKSKHLATAMIPIFGLELDVVNLRKESYAEDSRNPQMEFGTAEEDALRRDATINAMFYNLNTDSVEDFTTGFADLKAGIIRTPLEPLQTFRDDPLRVLRLVRFASRYDFSIAPETERFMADPSVLEALRVKISRERVGIELEKMTKDTHPRIALQIINRLNLYHAIFTDPAKSDETKPDISRWPVAYDGLCEILANESPGSLGSVLVRGEDGKFLAWNLAAVAPWISVADPPGTKKKANALPPVGVIAREGFKASNKLTDVMSACHKHRLEIVELKTAVCENAPYIQERDRFGMAIRRWNHQGGSWKLQVLGAMLVEAMEKLESWPSSISEEKVDEEAVKKRDAFIREWELFVDHLSHLEVMEAPTLRRLIDGRELAKALGVKPGKWTGQALDICVAWQLRNPKATDPAPAIEEVRAKMDELGIV